MSTIARLTLAQYDEMIRSGAFSRGAEEHVEFIRGEIREMSPIGSRHEEIVDRLTDWSIRSTRKAKIRVRIQNSIGLPELESAPQPDLAWVVQRDYSRGRPTAADVLLVIEVADSGLAYDRGAKAELYAEAGVADYWIVNVADRLIEVRRDPQGGRYRTVQEYTGDDEIRPLCEPELVLRPAMLWQL
jgi:Uma2 family endonuclease